MKFKHWRPGHITAAIAEAEKDKLFDRPAPRPSLATVQLLARIDALQKARAA